MDFQYCPKCEAFSPPGVTHCEQCKTELPKEELTPAPAIPLAPGPEPSGDQATPEPPVSEAAVARPTPFEASPEVLERVRHLEAEIAKKPGANALYLQLSQLYVDAKRKDLAIRSLERCLEHDPRNAYMRHRLEQLAGPPARSRPLPGTPVAAPGPAAAAQPRQGTAKVAMPMRPLYRHPVRRRRVSRWAVLGGIAGAVVLGLGTKLLFFPGPKMIVTGSFSAVAPKWSPTGRYVAFVQSGAEQVRLGVCDMKTGKHRDLADLASWDASAFAWAPDGQRIAYVGRDEQGWDEAVFVVDVERGQPRRVAGGRMPAWAPDGTTLLMWCSGESGLVQPDSPLDSEDGELAGTGAASYSDQEPPGLCQVDAETGSVIRRTADAGDASFGWGAEVSPVLSKVAFERAADEQPAPPPSRSGDGEFFDMVDSVAARRAENVAEGSRDLTRELEARARDRKRDGNGTSGYIRDVYVADFHGGPPQPLTTDGHSGSPVWTPDGERILFAGDGACG